MFGYFSTDLDDVEHLNEYQHFLDTLAFLAQNDLNVHTQLMAVLQGSQQAVALTEEIQAQATARTVRRLCSLKAIVPLSSPTPCPRLGGRTVRGGAGKRLSV